MTSRSVLIVDDDPIFRELAAAAFGRDGTIEVLTADNGRAASRYLSADQGRLRLIMLDLNMPDFDGIEFVGAMAELKITAPLLIASGAGPVALRSAETLCKAYGLNLMGVLAKPVDVGELGSIADALLQPQLQGDRARPVALRGDGAR